MGKTSIEVMDLGSGSTSSAFRHLPLTTSAYLDWDGIIVERHLLEPDEREESLTLNPIVTVNLGQPVNIHWREGNSSRPKLLLQGDICVGPRGFSPRCHWREKADVLVIALSMRFIASCLEDASLVGRIELLPVRGCHDSTVYHLGLALKAELENDAPSGRVYGESIATALCMCLLSRYSSYRATVQPALSKSMLSSVLEFIETNLETDLTLAQMAAIVNLSRSHFIRAFKKSTGRTPHEFLLWRRVERAKQLLCQQAKLPIAEIAATLGFADQGHFSRHFKRLVGITPGQFRT